MRLFFTFYLMLIGYCSIGQDANLLQHKRHFDKELKPWSSGFIGFKLSNFKLVDTLHFDNNLPQHFESLNEFLLVYRPIITYSVDCSKFIDIYSYQLNLEKRGSYYQANPVIDQTVFLYDSKAKYWNRIYFGTGSQWVDEVVWISKRLFLLVGVVKSTDGKKKPIILLGDTNSQKLFKYTDTNSQTYQSDNGYSSIKLTRLRIKGL